jgi:3-deoxy-D-manno-octulosonic-acid transferase
MIKKKLYFSSIKSGMLFYNLVILITGSLHFRCAIQFKISFCWRSENCFLYLRAKRPDKTIWFHAASLGEYEQGLPVIENKKNIHKIVITVGLWSTQNNTVADATVYLPLDEKMHNDSWNLFIRHGVFIKYEYWLNYLNRLKRKNTPTYLISIFENNKCSLMVRRFLQKSIRYFYLLFCAERRIKNCYSN